MGKPVLIFIFVNINLMADLTTGRYHTGLINLLNKYPIEWYYKLQYCVEKSTYGSEYAAAHICTDQIVYLHNNLRYLSILLHMINGSDASFVFGDIFLVVN